MWKFLTDSHPSGSRLPSPGGQHVAVLGPPQEIWGNYLATIALWATNPLQLLYYRPGYLAHALNPAPATDPVFGYWSTDGRWLVFYEFKRQESYQLAFIDVLAGTVARVPASDALLRQLPLLSQQSSQIVDFLWQAQPDTGPLVRNEVPAELRWP